MPKKKKRPEWKARISGTTKWVDVPGWSDFDYNSKDPTAYLDISAIAESGADLVCKCRKVTPDEIRIDLMDPNEMVVYDISIDVSWEPVFECGDVAAFRASALNGLLELLWVAEQDQAFCRGCCRQHVGERHLAGFVDDEDVHGLREILPRPHPLGASDHVDRIVV